MSLVLVSIWATLASLKVDHGLCHIQKFHGCGQESRIFCEGKFGMRQAIYDVGHFEMNNFKRFAVNFPAGIAENTLVCELRISATSWMCMCVCIFVRFPAIICICACFWWEHKKHVNFVLAESSSVDIKSEANSALWRK